MSISVLDTLGWGCGRDVGGGMVGCNNLLLGIVDIRGNVEPAVCCYC